MRPQLFTDPSPGHRARALRAARAKLAARALRAARRPLRGRAPALTVCTAALALACAATAAAAATPPAASTGAASGVSYSTATVSGYVDPNGEATDYVVQYGSTRGLGAQTSLAPVGSGTGYVKVVQVLTGLAPVSTYYYRILASSPAGASAGAIYSFKTARVPLSLAIAGAPNPVEFGSPFLVEGTLSGTGAGGHPIELQANPFPYTAGFQAVGNPELTNAQGGFSFPFLGLLENAQLRVVTIGQPVVSSAILTEGVAVRVTLHVGATRRRGYARLYGTVAPAEVGALVGFQLLRPGRSVNQGGTVVKPAGAGGSRFSRVVRVHRGVYEALVRVFDGAHMSAYSQAVLIR
ncbi:MAG TPA: fibronectin type III domain-containing protein [Solirubrobacteraceae bacterium]|nr:fibronectin type III domain-containing protein [Solirubrobacteraceae bacterium]